jgi:hypothetical protein
LERESREKYSGNAESFARLTSQVSLQVDAPQGLLPTRDHVVKDENHRKMLDVALSDDVTPTWKAMEKVSIRCRRMAISDLAR